MKKKPGDRVQRIKELRVKANKQLVNNQLAKELEQLTTDELIHELRVHQIELEMQNEELRRTQIALELSRNHYIELYDFAPVGYMSLDMEGVIIEINLTACKLLGNERKKILNQRFVKFISDEYKDSWHRHFIHVRQISGSYSCELQTRRENRSIATLKLDFLSINQADKPPFLRVTLTDITNYNETKEAELQKRIDRYELVLEGAQDAIWDWDVPNKSVTYSSRWKALRGFAEEEVGTNEKEWGFAIHPEDKARVFAAMQDHFVGNISVFCEEYRIQCKDGSWKWVLNRGIAKKDLSGQVVRMAGSESDITERKLAEQELCDRENQLSLIMNLAPALISYLDTDLRFVRVNKAYENWYGLSVKAIIGRQASEIVREKAWALAQPRLERALKGERTFFEDIVFKQDDARWVSASFVPDKDSSGKVKGIAVYVADITELKNAVHDLQERENQLQLIMDMMPAIISYMDIDFRYIRVNKVYEEWFGLATSGIIGRTVQEIIGEKAWKLAVPNIERARNGEIVSYEQYATYENGVSRWTKKNFVPVKDHTGKVKGIVVHVEDISDQKKHELALIEKENALTLIMNAMPALIAYVDTSYRYVRVNTTYEKWLGIPVENIVGQEIKTILGEGAWQTIQPYLEKAMSGEQVHYDLEMPYNTAKSRWIHVNYVPDMDSDGHVKGIVALIVDIGEIKQAEQEIALLNEALQHRVEEMEAIFNTAPIGLSITNDMEGKSIRGNKTLEKIMGHPWRREYSFKAIPEHAYQVKSNGIPLNEDELPMQRAIRGETLTNQVLDIHRPDGEVVTVLGNMSPLFTEQGEVRGAIGAFLDITEIKRTGLALRESEERLRLAQTAGNLGIFDQDLISGEMHWDERLRELWGVSPDEPLVTGTCMASVHPDDRAKVYAAVKRSFNPQGDGVYQAEYRIIRPTDDQTFWVAAFGITSFDNGRPARLVGFIQDITDRKHTEALLHINEIRLSLAMDALSAGFWEWEKAGNKAYFSPVWKKQLGYEDHELPNRQEEWENRLHPDDREYIFKTVGHYLSNFMPSYTVEFRLRHKDGSYRWIQSRAGLTYDQNNQLIRMAGIHLDITDYKKAKELNQQRDKMEETFQLNIASQTLAAIAHELNQPLTAISYFADVAVDMVQTGNKNPEKLADILENCSVQAQRAGQVIRQLFSVLQKGDTQNELVDINKMVSYASEYVKANKQLNSFYIKMNFADELPQVLANTLQIQKILIIIISNSLEAMQEHAGTVTITTRVYPDDASMAQITVHDTGTGVPDATMFSKMFQPFYTTKSTGLGMGLAISRTLIEAHGGKMWAEQNPDIGISIHFTLPLAS